MTTIANEPAPRLPLPMWRGRANVAYAAFVVAATLVCLPTVLTMVETWATSSAYHHGFLIAPLVVWLIARDSPLLARRLPPSLRGGRGGVSPRGEAAKNDARSPDLGVMTRGEVPPLPPLMKDEGGKIAASKETLTNAITAARSALPIVAIAASVLLWLIGRAGAANLIEQLAFVSLLISGAVAIYGVAWAKARAFPLALLYFMVPMGESLKPPLQQFAAALVTALLNMTGVETASDGLILTTSAGAFEIAPGCAGLNFVLASLLIASVYAHLALKGWKARAAFVAAGAVLALVANILRIHLVIAIATWSGGRIAIAADHLVFGWLLYGLLLIPFLLIGRRFAETGGQRERTAG